VSRILISGYYGFGNAGDEAVLAAILASLRRQMPEAQCAVLSVAPAATTRLHGVPAFHRARPREVLAALRRCDLFISGGGSLLQDVTSLSSLLFYLAQIQLARFLRRRVMIYAQGIGPLLRPVARRLTARTLRVVDCITVRDAESAAALRGIGLTGDRPPIEVTADPVFSLQPASAEWARAELQACRRARDEGYARCAGTRMRGEAAALSSSLIPHPSSLALGISLREWPGLEARLEVLAEVIREVARESGLVPVYFPLQRAQDAAVCRRLAERTGGGVLPGDYAPGEWMALAGQMDLFFGMRLHALIFAAAAGVPLVGLSYDPKVTSLLSRLGALPAASLAAFDADALRQALRDTWNVRARARVQIQEAASELAVAAEASARRAAELLGRRGTPPAERSTHSRSSTPASR
jgi:polysaccharide pyruvyl transferase CsaB